MLAEYISRLSGPPSEIPLILIFLFLKGGRCLISGWLFVFLLVGWVIPVVFFIYGLRRGWIKDLDATDRHDRYLAYGLTALCYAGLYLLARAYLGGVFLELFTPFCVLLIIIFFITLFYKISVHAAINAAFYLLLNQTASWFWWWLFPLVLLVCWSRWKKKRHTVPQLILGMLVPLIIFALF